MQTTPPHASSGPVAPALGVVPARGELWRDPRGDKHHEFFGRYWCLENDECLGHLARLHVGAGYDGGVGDGGMREQDGLQFSRGHLPAFVLDQLFQAIHDEEVAVRVRVPDEGAQCERCLEFQDEVSQLQQRLAASGQYVTYSPGPNPGLDVERDLQRWLAVNPRSTAAAGFRAGWARMARLVGPGLRDWEAR